MTASPARPSRRAATQKKQYIVIDSSSDDDRSEQEEEEVIRPAASSTRRTNKQAAGSSKVAKGSKGDEDDSGEVIEGPIGNVRYSLSVEIDAAPKPTTTTTTKPNASKPIGSGMKNGKLPFLPKSAPTPASTSANKKRARTPSPSPSAEPEEADEESDFEPASPPPKRKSGNGKRAPSPAPPSKKLKSNAKPSTSTSTSKSKPEPKSKPTKRRVVDSDSDSDSGSDFNPGGSDSDADADAADEAELLKLAESKDVSEDEAGSLEKASGEGDGDGDGDVRMSDGDGESVMSLEEKPKAKGKKKAASSAKKSSSGLSAAAQKKVAAAAADAGNLPPMNDLAQMFRDMITRRPGTSGGKLEEVDEDEEEEEGDGDAAKGTPKKGVAASGKAQGKQTTLFGFLKKDKEPQPSASTSTPTKSNSKGKAATAKPASFDSFENVDVMKRYTEPKGYYLAETVRKLGGRKLRVATMCSGTESPLLALKLISREMKVAYGVPFDVEHVFSCELEPYKQAYIERNFAPPILFRDVTELGNDHATTAYGASVPVPGNVDLLIAGTSCVDYSNLNNQKKDLDQKGESGNTFRGMLRWVTKHRPMIVVLENVCSAPWGKVADRFEEVGYSAMPHKFDTKDFYIPHTRTRGYLVAFRQPEGADKSSKKRSVVAPLPDLWVDMVMSMQRPASSPLEAFLLPPNDPRLHQGRLELAALKGLGKSRMPTDWGRCASRHEKCRVEEGLGTKRYWTEWRDGAICNFPEGYWNDWANAQTERVQDLLDVSHLRAARNGFDASFRTLVWNLSQNVDREIGSNKRPGIVPCMTPTMIPYVTNRGGPLIGIEALALQGIPADELLLTRETEDQLADLAGNAMSSTVVGTCVLAAIILATNFFDGKEVEEDVDMDAQEEALVVDSTIAAIGEGVTRNIIGQDQLASHPLDLAKSATTVTNATVFEEAARSARYCLCEGPSGTSVHATLKCTACRHTRCSDCSNRPLHEYEAHPHSEERIDAMTFARKLKSVLPMRLVLDGFTMRNLENLRGSCKAECTDSDWNLWSRLVVRSLRDTEFHFKALDRKHQWHANFDAPTASLRLTISEDKAVWLLYIKAPASDNANARRRKLMSFPAARMIVPHGAKNLLDGKWDLQLPTTQTCKIAIQGKGELVYAWESKIGLQQKIELDQHGKLTDKVHWQDRKQWSELEVSITSEDAVLDAPIGGTYKLHPACGTAMECLHIQKGGKISLFLDPVRCGFTQDDPFVFALDHERLDYDQERVTIAKVDAKWRPRESADVVSTSVSVHGTWQSIDTVNLHPMDKTAATFAIPEKGKSLAIDVSPDSCADANALLVCKVPLPHADAEQIWSSVKGSWGEIELQHKGKQAFDALAWITERLPPLDKLKQWSSVKLGGLVHDGSTTCCARCAPTPPELSWMIRETRLVPVEDVVQAGQYERALKNRPAPLVAQLRLDGGVGTLQIGLNVATLVHRAMSRLPSLGRTQAPELTWRLQTDYQAVETAFFRPPRLSLSSNRHDTAASQPPHWSKKKSVQLRPEQLRSLTWMLEQEAEKDHSFIEEEIAEATLGPLGWRAEGRASRKVHVRGGVLADQVGYGKTAISLALIDTSNTVDEYALPNLPRPGRIVAKGTLVVVPPHLTKQWEGEIHKFLGSRDYSVLKLLDLSSFNSTTVEDIESADIIIVALSVFKSLNYWSNLAGFAAAGSLPNGDLATRHFISRLDQILLDLDEQVERLQGEDGAREANAKVKESLAKVKAERVEAKKTKDAFITTFGKKRLTGAAYLAMQEGEVIAPKAKKAKTETNDREDNDPWRLGSKEVRKDWKRMTSPPLHMFRFNRVIIDEFTYIDQRCLSAVNKLESISTWVLSGTPPVSDFAAVKGIADFLHIHLGVDDDTEGSHETAKKRMKGQTAAEAFHSFREVHTASWHAARYGVAQRFLDTFVRQNVAEINEIESVEHVVTITLPAAEHAIYLELDHHINSLQGMTKKVMKSAKGAKADRQLRLSDALGSSSDPREALIKRCAHFDMESEGSKAHDAYEACERIVQTRTKQRELCEEDLHYTISEAIQLYLYIKDVKKGYSDPKLGLQERKTSHFIEYLKATFSDVGNGDADATARHRKIINKEGLDWVNNDAKVDREKHLKAVKSRPVREDELGNSKIDTKLKVDELKWQLREKSHVLRKLANELVGRTRSLRYFTAVRDVQRNGDGCLPPCVKCEGESGSEPCVLSACGHTGCRSCLAQLAINGFECPHEGCRINLESHQVIPTNTLGREEKSGRFGAKLLQLVAIIKAIKKPQRILIFVQFDDLLAKIRAALKAAKIGTIVIEGSAKNQANELDRFQNLDPNDHESERVLILNVAAASASGANLTLANHAIFVHPVHYPEGSNDRFIATETQAIGRIRRYGQNSKCSIYRLLTANTVDESIMIERTGGRPSNTWPASSEDTKLGINWSSSGAASSAIPIEISDEDADEVEAVATPKRRVVKTKKAGQKRKRASSEESEAEASWVESD